MDGSFGEYLAGDEYNRERSEGEKSSINKCLIFGGVAELIRDELQQSEPGGHEVDAHDLSKCDVVLSDVLGGDGIAASVAGGAEHVGQFEVHRLAVVVDGLRPGGVHDPAAIGLLDCRGRHGHHRPVFDHHGDVLQRAERRAESELHLVEYGGDIGHIELKLEDNAVGDNGGGVGGRRSRDGQTETIGREEVTAEEGVEGE